jgi:hypothetical protein
MLFEQYINFIYKINIYKIINNTAVNEIISDGNIYNNIYNLVYNYK